MKLVALLLCSACCGPALPDAIAYAPDGMASVTVTLDVRHRSGVVPGRLIGECIPMADGNHVVVHLGEISDIDGAALTDVWVRETLDHELRHAADVGCGEHH